jgi:Fe-S cluster biosynthesis and repair protein YggX
MHKVYCLKLKQESEGLPRPPYPGPLGEKIYNNISLNAWRMWQSHQTMLINEYRLNLLEPEARKFLEHEMEKFLFGEGSEKPPGFQEAQ